MKLSIDGPYRRAPRWGDYLINALGIAAIACLLAYSAIGAAGWL